MKGANPLFSYLSVLAIIQPARIQDIETSSMQYLDFKLASWLQENNRLRIAHETARNTGLVTQIRRGVYFMTPTGRQIVRRAGLELSIDNRRMFLMKQQRKRYK